MKHHRTKKRARSQGRNRKCAVVIPPIPELDEHAEAIRRIGKQSFEGAVEIGRRLEICRRLLKTQRDWLAWIKREFRWSRAHADNLIGLYLNRGKLLKFSSLPISALYLLTKASPKLIQKIEQDVEAGERLFVREIQRQTRAERTSITYTSSTEPSSTRRVMNLTAPQEEPTKPQRVITAEDINEGFGLLHAGLALRQLETFWAWFVGVPPDKFTAMLPASQHKRLRQVLHAIIALSNSHLEKLWEAGKPRLVSDEGDGR